MQNITEIKDKIEQIREEVASSLGNEPYEVTYEKNLELDRLIEQYLDAKKEISTSNHPTPPPATTIE